MYRKLFALLLSLCLILGMMPTIGFAYSGETGESSGGEAITKYYRYELVASGTTLSSDTTYYESATLLENNGFTTATLTSTNTDGTVGEECMLGGKYIYASKTEYELRFIKASPKKTFAVGDPVSTTDFNVKAYYAVTGTNVPQLVTSTSVTQEQNPEKYASETDENYNKYKAEMDELEGDTASGTNWFVATVTNGFTIDKTEVTAEMLHGDEGSPTSTEYGVKVTYGTAEPVWVSLQEKGQIALTATSTNGDHGTVMFKVGDSEVDSVTPTDNVSGTDVTMEITPYDGWKVDNVSSADVTLGSPTNQENGETHYSFNVTNYEKEKVTITVSYAEDKHTITLGSCINGTITVKASGTDISTGSEIQSGTILTVEASPNENYVLKNISVTKADASNTNVAVDGNTFKMPACDVTVSAEFIPKTDEMQDLNSILTAPNMTLATGIYYLTGDLELDGNAGAVKGNGFRIAEGADVKIYLNGYTLNVTGKDAEDGSVGLAGERGSGDKNRSPRPANEKHGAGGYAGILLPADSTLYFIGSGTVNAKGGNAGKGGNGGNGGKGTSDVHYPPPINSDDDSSGGGGGQGGGGGGGAGAGIGTNGTAGFTNNTSSNVPATAGNLIFCEDETNSIITNITGGNNGAQGTQGSAGGGSYSKKYIVVPTILLTPIPLWDEACAGGGGGGGAGGAGGAAASYGSGGYGGEGGASGISGTSNHTTTHSESHKGADGTAGQFGNNGVFGTANPGQGETGTYDPSTSSPTDYRNTGVKTTATNFTLKGLTVESKFSDIYDLGTNTNIEDVLKDEINDDAIDVWAYYGNSTVNFAENDALNGGYDNNQAWMSFKLESIPTVNASNTDTYKVEVDISEIQDAKDYIEDSKKATISVTYAPVNHDSKASTVSATDIVFIGEKQAVTKNMQPGYVTVGGGDAVKFNDGKETLNIGKTPEKDYSSSTGYAKGAAYKFVSYDNHDYKFESTETNYTLGTFTNTSNKLYTVHYTPYNAYLCDDNDTMLAGGRCLLGSDTNYASGSNYDALKALPFRNAGLYKITEYCARHDDRFVGSPEEVYYTTYFVVIQQADLEITNAINTVTAPTTVQDHTFDRVVIGRNGETVRGQYTFASNKAISTVDTYCYDEDWGDSNEQNRIANMTTPDITGISWEFNVKHTYNTASITDVNENATGDRNMNNYLDQNDGKKLSKYKGTDQTIGGTDITGDLKADRNTFYSGINGELHYSSTGGMTVLNGNAYLEVQAKYEDKQKIDEITSGTDYATGTDNQKTSWDDLAYNSDVATNTTITSIFAEDIAFGASFSNADFGFRVNDGDAVNGSIPNGTPVTSVPDKIKIVKASETNATVTNLTPEELFSKLVSGTNYKGDYYVVSVKDKNNQLVKAWEYNDTSESPVNSNNPVGSKYGLASETAWDAIKAGTYTVTVQYVGLYYQNNTGNTGRQSDWSGGEYFNWVTAEKSFTLKVEPRNIAYKPSSDLYKVYDGTELLVKDVLGSNTNAGDVIRAEAYIIDMAHGATVTNQFSKGLSNAISAGSSATDFMYNYLQPEDYVSGYKTALKLELAGTYPNGKVSESETVTITNARLLDTADDQNYKLVKVNNQEMKGDVYTAQMYVTHDMTPSIIVHNTTPMRDALNLRVQAYMPPNRSMSYGTNGFLATSTDFVKQELVSCNDETKKSGNPVNNSLASSTGATYDYDAEFELILDNNSAGYIKHASSTNYVEKNDGLEINRKTGAIIQVANLTNSSSIELCPKITVKLVSFSNYVLVKQTESNYPGETYGSCVEGTANGKRDTTVYNNYYAVASGTNVGESVATNNTLTHTLRYQIVGNGDTFNLILPINQLNNRGVLSSFTNKTGDAKDINVDLEKYQYVTVYENGDSADFSFAGPQDSYLKDVKIVAIPRNNDGKTPTEDSSAMPKFANIGTTNVVGKFSSNTDGVIATKYKASNCNIILKLLKVNGELVSDTSAYFGGSASETDKYSQYKLAHPNEQIGGSTYTFRFTTGESAMGTEYNIIIVPVFEKYGKLLADTAATASYKTNISVEKKVSSSTDSTLATGTDTEDKVFVNYKALWDTNASDTNASGTNYGSITMEYVTSAGTSTNAWALASDTTGFKSFGVDVNADKTFFNPETLVPGTKVKVTLKLWRNGVVSGVQSETSDDDALDFVTFTWTVSDAEYFALFGDDNQSGTNNNNVVTFFDGNSRIGYGIVSGTNSTMDFTAVNFVSTSGAKNASKNMKAYSKDNYKVDGWYTDSALTTAVSYTDAKYVDVSENNKFYLKSTASSGGGGGFGGGGFGGGAPVYTSPTDDKEDEKIEEAKPDVEGIIGNIKIRANSSYAKLKGRYVTKVYTTVVEGKEELDILEKAGYIFKYDYYRSTTKKTGYKLMLSKGTGKYYNTKGTRGKMYYYRAVLTVYDKEGNMVAKTKLNQCKYGNRAYRGYKY